MYNSSLTYRSENESGSLNIEGNCAEVSIRYVLIPVQGKLQNFVFLLVTSLICLTNLSSIECRYP